MRFLCTAILHRTGYLYLLPLILINLNCQNENRSRSIENEQKTESYTVKKVYIHYMGWYGDTIADSIHDDIERHWKYGHANTPEIGLYDSKNRSLLTYHILLSWSCGIDGIVINVKDSYDDICMKSIIRTMKWLRSIDSVNFSYEFGISYDDQGLDLAYPYDTTNARLCYLRDSILPELPVYIRYKDRPALFVFDYPEKFMTAKGFRNVLNEVFRTASPITIWNSPDDKENSKKYVDAFYPWVQPGNKGWDKEGLNWGKEYLDWYYPRVNAINTDNQYIFTCGGVWPGFDDTKNISWGDNRVITRGNGQVYDSTWSYVLNYKDPLPLPWVIVETWNDWNEGTEIEPSLEDGNKYLLSTIRNINAFKGTSIDYDAAKFEAAQEIYRLFSFVENGTLEAQIYEPQLKKAIGYYLKKEYDHSLQITNSILKEAK